MFKRAIVIILGILLMPVCVSFTLALYEQLAYVGNDAQNRPYFLFGIAAYLFVHIFLYVPDRLYKSEHKGLNAAVKWVSAGKIKKLNPEAKAKEDEIHPNVILILAPHFVPLYAILSVLVYCALSLFWQVASFLKLLMLFMGAGLIFHMAFTAEAFKSRHKSLIGSAYILSLTLIYIFNIIVITFALSLLFNDISMKDFFVSAYKVTAGISASIFRQLFGV